MTILELEHINKTFAVKRDLLGKSRGHVRAVRDVSISLAEGETLAIVGESGSGKSTLARIAMSLLKPDSGRVLFRGRDLARLPKRALRPVRPSLQMVFQDPYTSLDPRMVISEQIIEPLKVHRLVERSDRRDRASELLQRVGLSSYHEERYPYEMSGGQLQRVAIARALATNPEVIVCDEPVAALDMSIRAQVINLLRDLQDESGIALLFISHDLSLVRFLAHNVAVMCEGQVVETGPTRDVFRSPQHEYTKQLLDAAPIPDPTRRNAARLAAQSGAAG